MKALDEIQSEESIGSHLFENIFFNHPIATALVSGNLKTIACNKAFQTFFQLSDEEVNRPTELGHLGSSFWQKTEVQQYVQFVLEDKATYNEKTFDWQHEDGSLKHIQIQSQLLQPSEQTPTTLLLTFSDVSAFKQIENEHNQRIRHMMHELRNPLSNISLCVELLADSTKENNQEDTDMFLTKASASVQRMKQLINDLNAAKKNS